MENQYIRAMKAAEEINAIIGKKPDLAVILGSGLGTLANSIKNPIEIPYQSISGFPSTTVHGHEGKLVIGNIDERTVLAMKGRFHYYEGNQIEDVVLPVRVFKAMGIDKLIVTNAAGGINKSFKPGTLMLIKDHLSFFVPSPLRGTNIEEFGSRFPDMSNIYEKKFLDIAKTASIKTGVEISEGVYSFMQGPMYETPAEIRALAALGADAVGMSTVPEAIVARHAGMKVLGISCITNMASGILETTLDHKEVIETAAKVEKNFVKLVEEIICNI